jgi:hypothetical protein
MFFSDIRLACKFEINANLIRYVQEGFEEFSELCDADIRAISRDVENEIHRSISFGKPFDMFHIIAENLRKRDLVR